MPGSTIARGYGARHKRERERLRALVESGAVSCARCGYAITPQYCLRCGRPMAKGRPSPGYCGWDLGHDDFDRELYSGPEHTCCNRSAGTRKRNRRAAIYQSVTSRDWFS